MTDYGEKNEKAVVDPTVVFVSGFGALSQDKLTEYFAGLSLNPKTVELVGREKTSALLKFGAEEEASKAVDLLEGKAFGDNTKIVARLDRGPRNRPRRQPRPETDSPREKAPATSIFVGNLGSGIKKDDLASHFSHYGVESAKVLGSWGIVELKTKEDAEASLALNGQEFHGRELKVEALLHAPRKRTKKARKPKTAREGDSPNSAPKTEPAPRGTGILIKSSPNTTFEQLKEQFSRYGTLNILEYKQGLGYVGFETEAEAQSAFEALNKIELKGQPLVLTRSHARRRNEENEDKGEDTQDRPRRRRNRNRNRKRGPRGTGTADDDEEAHEETKQPRPPREPRPNRENRDGNETRQPRAKKSPPIRSVTNPESHLFVGNLVYALTDEELHEKFRPYGVKSAKVAQGRTGRSRGFGSVELESESAAQEAIKDLHGEEFQGRSIIVRADRFVVGGQ